MYYGAMDKPLDLNLDRTAKMPLAEQIRRGVTRAIEDGVLEPGARLPSWQDLAAQLGVARGTVRSTLRIGAVNGRSGNDRRDRIRARMARGCGLRAGDSARATEQRAHAPDEL